MGLITENKNKDAFLMEDNLKNNSYLIITASGGAGILQAAKAQAQRLKKQDPNAKIVVKDMMLQWLGGFFGNFGVNSWNKAQKKGKVRYQELLVSFQRLAEIFFWPKIFYFAFRTLIKEDIDYIYDTQPLGTSAIVKAVRLFNLISKKKIIVRKIFVDLPSKRSTHYYNNIKRLSNKDREYIYVSTIEPQLEENQTDEEFWKKYCNLPLNRVCYKSYPIRLDFDDYTNKIRKPIDYTIKIKAENENEKTLIDIVTKRGNIDGKKIESGLEFIIKPNDFLITILLGSQPAFNSTLSYVQNLMTFLKNSNIKRNVVIFSYCSIFKDGLIKKMHDMIMSYQDYSKNLTVVPMSFQDENVIALLFFRSDMTITRSGGQTAVELLRVAKAKICVHSEYRGDNPTEKKLLKGIPAWEAGSAYYMKEIMNASIVNPDIFIDLCKDLIIN